MADTPVPPQGSAPADPRICDECGARSRPDDDRCSLCGAEFEAAADPPPAPSRAEHSDGAKVRPAAGVFCNSCGWKNPPGARFCSQCGTALQAKAATATPAPERPAQPPVAVPDRPPSPPKVRSGAQRAVLLVAAGSLLVVALYFVTLFSKQSQAPIIPQPVASGPAATPTPQSPAQPLPASDEPLPDAIAEEVADLEARVAEASGAERVQAQSALVNLLVGVGRMDLAAPVQEAIAVETAAVEAWRRTGNLYYDWMEQVEGGAKIGLAQRAIAAYQQVLAQEPADADVRTDMAWAYQYDPQSPMQAITQTNMVLEQEPDHVAANFNKGIFLMRIRRFDQAIDQFERVKEIVGEGSPYFMQANDVIATLRDLQAGEGPPADDGGGGGDA